MQLHGRDIGVCGWSLPSTGLTDLLACVKGLGLQHVQLSLGPLLMLDDKRKHQALGQIRSSEISITAGMIDFPGEDYSTIAVIRSTAGYVPDTHWPLRKRLTLAAGKLAEEMKIGLITTHVGFIPRSSDPEYETILARVRELAQSLDECGVTLLFETGQETASGLLQFLNDVALRNVGANFDPANMILYGAGDPIEAVTVLGRHIGHVHVKDARLSSKPGIEWGEEVPFGTGEVNPTAFLAALDTVGYRGPLVIEREAKPTQEADIRAAIGVLAEVSES